MQSDKYTYFLLPLQSAPTKTIMDVLEIRNHPDIRKWMYTDDIIDKKTHIEWAKSLHCSTSQFVYAVVNTNDQTVGAISINNLNNQHKKADWAYYLSPSAQGNVGPALEFTFIDYIFDYFKINKLNCEVIKGNETVVSLHKKFHFKDEGFKKSEILKNGERIGVYLLGLTKEDWQNNKEALQKKYTKVFSAYSFEINEPIRP